MSVIASDISLLLSGGATNISSALSLGGQPSDQQVDVSTLFSDIPAADTVGGVSDYRCIYVFNDNSTETLAWATVAIYSEISGGAEVNVGLNLRPEIQKIIINGTATGGDFVLRYFVDDVGYSGYYYYMTVAYDADADVWNENLKNALRSCPSIGFDEAETQVVQTASSTIFTITIDTNRYYDLLELDSNNLVGSPTIIIRKIQSGSPINAVAPMVESSQATPPHVSFDKGPLVVGQLQPFDGFALWIERIVAPDTSALADDGFVLRISGLTL
jgi:hypothetical protein